MGNLAGFGDFFLSAAARYRCREESYRAIESRDALLAIIARDVNSIFTTF